MKSLIRQAEEILDVAVSAHDQAVAEFNILIGHDGGMRIVERAGWGLAGLLSEYGARAVYRVERRGGKVRVEGWSGFEKCVLDRETPAPVFQPCYPGLYATRSQVVPLAIAGSNECSPHVLNSYRSI